MKTVHLQETCEKLLTKINRRKFNDITCGMMHSHINRKIYCPRCGKLPESFRQLCTSGVRYK